jgi:hypothetical protein
MSDFDPNDPEPGSPADLREQLKQEREAKAAAVADATADLQRELAFTKAGIDTDTDAGKIFARGYDGELTSEAIKAAAAGFNLAPAPVEPPADPEVALEPNEAAVLAAGAELGGTPPPAEPPTADPYEDATRVFEEHHANGSRIEAVGFALNSVANAANRGDQRVIVPGPGSPVGAS